MLGHLVNTPLAILFTSVDALEASLDPGAAHPRMVIERACSIVDDARVGLDRVRALTSTLLSALGGARPRGGAPSTEPTSKVLVVTGDSACAAAICNALPEQHVTVCRDFGGALGTVERVEPFRVVFCDASAAAVWLLVRIARQEPPPRLVFLMSEGSDPHLGPFLRERATVLFDPVADPQRVRDLAGRS
jgi:hypothetical protein